MSKDSLKRKIAGLRAKTTSSGCTEAEALAAAALAAKLMREHGVSEAEIEFITACARTSVSVPRWQCWLINAICENTNTSVLLTSGYVHEVEFAGKEHSVEIALYLRDVLTRAVNAEIRSLRASSAYRRLRKASSKSDMVNSFAAGMISRLSHKLHGLFSETINADERAIAKKLLEEKYQEISSRSARKFTISYGQAYSAGRQAGEAVQLSHGVSSKGSAPLMIGRGG